MTRGAMWRSSWLVRVLDVQQKRGKRAGCECSHGLPRRAGLQLRAGFVAPQFWQHMHRHGIQKRAATEQKQQTHQPAVTAAAATRQRRLAGDEPCG